MAFSEAATFVLTGRTPEVFVYSGSLQIRSGMTAATSRVVMTLDPFLTPEQVAGIYARLKAQIVQGPAPKASTLRRYRLAQHVGPHVQISVHPVSHRVGPGRRPRPGSSGMVQSIAPLDGQTWESLRRTWNALWDNSSAEAGRALRYDSRANFTRDAQLALRGLLFPGWRIDTAAPD